MTLIVYRGRWHWFIPRTWHTTIRGTAHALSLLTATAALTGLGYWLLVAGHHPISLIGAITLDAPAYAALFWLLARDRSSRELIDKAVDDADRALGAAQDRDDDEQPTGRHHRSQP